MVVVLIIVIQHRYGSQSIDIHFINQIGINSLVKETWRVNHCYEFGEIILLTSESDPIGSFNKSRIYKLLPTKPYSWFYDQTHDNPCQIEKRSVEDSITRSACVAMA
ncbi:unnamed protein product, partial [Rotaria socialis]